MVEDCDDMKKVAGLARVLRSEVTPDLGLLIKDGQTCTPEETLEYLCDTHFPNNRKHKCKDQRTRKSKVVNISNEEAAYISEEKVYASIGTFKGFKKALVRINFP